MRISDWSSDVCSSDLGEDTCFVGYDGLSAEAKVLALYRDGQAVDALNVGDAGVVVLDNTPFYAESGGQVGDRGTIGSFDACRIGRSEEHTSELPSLMRISYAVFCLKKKNTIIHI